MDIAEWLRGLGLDQYLPAFRANDIDGKVLRRPDGGRLAGVGVASIVPPLAARPIASCSVGKAVMYGAAARTSSDGKAFPGVTTE
jgi:SAM domain (Sterile alpha motif)